MLIIFFFSLLAAAKCSYDTTQYPKYIQYFLRDHFWMVKMQVLHVKVERQGGFHVGCFLPGSEKQEVLTMAAFGICF